MPHHILVLGGSTFMGKTLLKNLSEIMGYDLHYVNRGRKYWNNEVKSIPNLNYTYGNREEKQDFSRVLLYLSKKLGISAESSEKWEIVVDFSAFTYKHIRSVYNALNGKIRLYIFISSDSVYEVCDKSLRTTGKMQESWDTRPEDAELSKKLIKSDTYGHDKLKCEEFLHYLRFENRENFAFPFIILRLPDVIGPYDDSNRYWGYLQWLENYGKFDLQTSKEIEEKGLSFVYSCDVAELIEKIAGKVVKNTFPSENLFKSYNLACEEPVKLSELLNIMCEHLKIPKRKIVFCENPLSFYPSVDCGPVSIEKARESLEWKPSSLKKALEETSAFFIGAKGKYKEEQRKVEEKIKKKLKL